MRKKVVFIFIVLLIIIILVYNFPEKPPLYQVRTAPTVGFGLSNISLNKDSLPYRFITFSDNRHIYLEFVDNTVIPSDDGEYGYTVACSLIDLERQKSVIGATSANYCRPDPVYISLAQSWLGVRDHSGAKGLPLSQGFHHTDFTPMQTSDGEVGIAAHHTEGYDRRISEMDELVFINSSGEIIPLKLPSLYHMISTTNRFISLDRSNEKVAEFYLTEEGLIEKRCLSLKYLSHHFLLPDDSYFGEIGKLVFYANDGSSTIREFSLHEIVKACGFESTDDENSWMRILQNAPHQPAYIKIHCKEKIMLVKFHLDQLRHGTAEDLFEWMAVFHDVTPYYVSHDESVILTSPLPRVNKSKNHCLYKFDEATGQYQPTEIPVMEGIAKGRLSETQPFENKLIYFYNNAIRMYDLVFQQEEVLFPKMGMMDR